MKNLNSRKARKVRIRKKVVGSGDAPRLSIFRSNQFIYAQLIDDSQAKTLAASSDVKITEDKKTKKERAFEAGQQLAKSALKKNIKAVVFDRSGYKYHGRVKSFAEGAREGGLEF